jgi:uncharacterized protein YjdB
MGKTWNADFTKVVPVGAAGNQAQKGIFYEDARGRIRRLTEAEGHEVSYNPETEETNPIGQEASETLVRSFNESFAKDIIIKKGALNHEFFKEWLNLRPTGDNAKLKIYMVDFTEEELGTAHNKYLAYSYLATCTVESGNYTDGRLTVNFTQAGDRTTGIIFRTDDSTSDDELDYVYEFKPSTKIGVTNINLSSTALEMEAGQERKIEVSFSPLGAPFDFTADEDVPAGEEPYLRVSRERQSVVIRALRAGTATITVQSMADVTKTEMIEVTVA